MARQPEIQYIRYYTDGSAARKPEVSMPRKKKPALPKARKQKKRVVYLDPLAVGGIIVSAVMLVLMLVGSIQLYNVRNYCAQMEQYVADLSVDNKTLSHTYENGYDLQTVEEVALAIGMIPQQEAQTITIHVPQQSVTEENSLWEDFFAFLTGIFA